MVKNPSANAGDLRDLGSIPWRKTWQPTPGFLPGDRGAWRATVHGLAKSSLGGRVPQMLLLSAQGMAERGSPLVSDVASGLIPPRARGMLAGSSHTLSRRSLRKGFPPLSLPVSPLFKSP